jgi:hypothetical protein
MNVFRPGPVPRVQGRYLVVAPGTTLPRLCVRTGGRDDLIALDEDVRVSRAVERSVGMFGAAWSYESARLRYFVSRRELERLRGWRRLCVRALLGAMIALAAGLALRSSVLIVACFGLICLLVGVFWMLPTPLSVAAVWGGQIFLLRIPPEMVREVMRDEGGGTAR